MKNSVNREKLLRTIISIALCIIGAIFTSASMSFDPDMLWHYKLGEEVLQNGTISLHDTFSWQDGLIWSQHEWLYDILIYLVIKYTDMVGYTLLFILNYCAVFILGYIVNGKGYTIKQSTQYVIFTVFVMMFMPLNRFNRPAELSIWFFILMIYLYHRNFKYKKIVYFSLGCLIANFHGGSLVVMLVCWILMIVVDAIYDKIENRKLSIRSEALNIIVFVLGTFINPLGVKQIPALAKVETMVSTKEINEWLPLNANYMQAILVIFMALAIGYNLHKTKLSRNTVRTSVICCALGVLTLTSVKGCINFILFYIIFCYSFVNVMLQDTWEFIFSHNKSMHEYEESYKKREAFQKKLNKTIQTVSPALLTVVIFCGLSVRTTDSFEELGYKYSLGTREMLQYIKENNLQDKRFMHGYVMGNYLVWGDVPCFVDTRQTPYEPYLDISTNTSLIGLLKLKDSITPELPDMIINKYKPDYIITNKELKLDWYLDNNEDWELVFRSTEQDKKDDEDTKGSKTSKGKLTLDSTSLTSEQKGQEQYEPVEQGEQWQDEQGETNLRPKEFDSGGKRIKQIPVKIYKRISSYEK